MNSRSLKAFLLCAVFFASTACSSVWIGKGAGQGQGRGKYKSYRTLGIPPGHLPPPGKCRVWYPGEPPGKQPAPQDCAGAFSSARPGTWVISGLPDKKLKVTVYDNRKNGKIKKVDYYTID